jgi:hypothetical protein
MVLRHRKGQCFSQSLPYLLSQAGPAPYATDLGDGPGPETELPSQAGPEPEPDSDPDVASPSQTEQEPTRPMRYGPGSDLGPSGPDSEPDRTSPSQTTQEPDRLQTRSGT